MEARSGNLHRRMLVLLDIVSFSVGETFGEREVCRPAGMMSGFGRTAEMGS